MVKDKNVKNWILVSLLNTSKRMGVNHANLYYSRPDYMDSLDFSKFVEIFRKLEKQKYIIKASFVGGNSCISEKGEDYIISELKRIKKTDYGLYSLLLQSSPFVELKEKINNIQYFIVNSMLLFSLIYFINKFPQMNSKLLIILIILTGVFFVFTLSYIMYITKDVGLEIRKQYALKMWSFIDRKESTLLNILYVLYLIGLIMVLSQLIKFLGWESNNFVISLIIALCSEYLLKHTKIKREFKRIKDKLKHKHIGKK